MERWDTLLSWGSWNKDGIQRKEFLLSWLVHIDIDTKLKNKNLQTPITCWFVAVQ